jgi:hypothetical protein
VWLELGQLAGVDHLELDAVGLAPSLVLGDLRRQHLGRAVEAQIAGPSHHAQDACVHHQRLVL